MCAYCNERRAVNQDHVIPRSVRKRYKHVEIPAALLVTVPSCFECNIRKGTRKLVPPSLAKSIPLLKELIPGQWRVWNGDPNAKSFTAVWK